MTENIHARSSPWNEKYLAYVTLFATAIAITYDVGYFYAIKLSFFTLFSLSEHVVFALQALPLAFLLIPFGALAILCFEERPHAHWRRSTAFRITYVVLAFLVAALVSYVSHLLSFWIGYILAVELILLSIVKSFPFRVAMTISIILTISFLAGYASSRSVMSYALNLDKLHFKNGPTINGQIIRSGDRGVMFYDSDASRLRFDPWDGISSIEAIPASK